MDRHKKVIGQLGLFKEISYVSVCHRDLSMDEGHQYGTHRIKIRRTQVVLASNLGYKVPVITELFRYSESYVRAIFKELKECCLKALGQKSRSSYPTEFTKDDRTFIARRVKCPQFLKVSIAEKLYCQTYIFNPLAQLEQKLQSLQKDSAFFGSISGTGPLEVLNVITISFSYDGKY